MVIRSSDIISRKADNEMPAIWISEQYLMHLLGEHGLSEQYLRCKARPQYKQSVLPCHRSKTFLPATGKAWRWAKMNGTFYYDVDSIPDKAPQHYSTYIPARKALQQIRAGLKDEQKALPIDEHIEPYLNEYYKEFLPNYGDCTHTQQLHLSKAAAFVKACVDYINTNRLPLFKNDFFETLSRMVVKHDIRYVPKHYRRLKETIIKSGAGGNDIHVTDVIKLPRANNTNAVQHADDDEIRSWIIQMRRCGKNYTDAYIIRKVQYMCSITGKKPPQDKWIGDVMREANTKWLTSITRYGEKGRLADAYRGYTPLENAVHAGDCWQIDGTRVNLVNFKLNDKDAFLYIVAVRDVHSGDILGYSFDISENRWVVHNALKMAAEETGYLPYQLIADRFPGHNTPEMQRLFADMRNRGVTISLSHKSTGKARLERWFSTMQQVFMQESDYYYGEGIQSKNKFAHRSKEQLANIRKAAKAEGWDFDKAADEACKLIEAYRNTALSYYSRKYSYIQKSPAQLHNESDKPNTVELAPNQMVYLFGLRTERKFTGDGLLTIQIQNYPFAYRCADANIVSQHERVMICYDLEDINTVHLYEISDKAVKKYLGTADEINVQVYGPEANYGKLQKDQAIIIEMQNERERQLQMKMAAGSDVNVNDVKILLGGIIPKHEYEDAESCALIKQFGSSDDDTDMSGYDISDQY